MRYLDGLKQTANCTVLAILSTQSANRLPHTYLLTVDSLEAVEIVQAAKQQKKCSDHSTESRQNTCKSLTIVRAAKAATASYI